MFNPSAAVLDEDQEVIQANIGVMLVQELDSEIPDAEAEKIEADGEVQPFAIGETAPGESPAEEIMDAGHVRPPSFFNIPQSSDDGEETEADLITRTTSPKAKAMPKAATLTTSGTTTDVIDLTLPIESRTSEPSGQPTSADVPSGESLGRSRYAFFAMGDEPTSGYRWLMGCDLPPIDRDYRRLN